MKRGKNGIEAAPEQRFGEPEAMRTLREQEERMRALADSPALKAMREYGERMKNVFDSPAVRVVVEQEERMRALTDSPALRAMREYEEQMKNALDSPVVRELIAQEEQMRKLAQPAIQSLAHQRSSIGAIFENPAIRAFIDQQESVARTLHELGAVFPRFEPVISLEAANAMLSRSIFGSEMTEALRLATEQGFAKSIGSAILDTIGDKSIHTLSNVRMLEETLRDYGIAEYLDDFKNIGVMSRAAQSVLQSVELDSLGDLIGISDPTELQRATTRLNKSYAKVTELAATAPASLVEAPFMARIPPIAVYSHARVMRSITTHDGVDESTVEIWHEVQSETTDVIETTLPRVNRALLTSWRGGFTTASRRGPDWVRQAAASLRYVLITTLDTLAPKDRVLADGADRKHVSPKGEPTRTGQIYWLCRSLKNKTYRRMVLSDLESALDIIDAMSEAVHREEYPEIEQAFGSMSVRAAVALRHLLEISRTSN